MASIIKKNNEKQTLLRHPPHHRELCADAQTQFSPSIFDKLFHVRPMCLTRMSSFLLLVFGVCCQSTFGSPLDNIGVDNVTMNGLTICNTKTDRPVIGILTQVLRDYKRFSPDPKLHLVASYVKWLEASGARIVPILLDQNDEYYERMFKQTNGLLFPGGDNSVDPNRPTPMMLAAKKLYQLAVAANDAGHPYPIWGTCLGFEMLATLAANSQDVLVQCAANDIALNVEWIQRGRLFSTPAKPVQNDHFFDNNYIEQIVQVLERENVTYHFHHMCVTPDSFEAFKLDRFFRPLSYSFDSNGLKFISMFEAINYPFYGVIYHPEKASYEFRMLKHQANIPHTWDAIQLARYLSDYFVRQARQNDHDTSKIDPDDRNILIYDYHASYTGLVNDMYEQRYMMPFVPKPTTSTVEFIHRKYRIDDDPTQDAPDPVEDEKLDVKSSNGST